MSKIVAFLKREPAVIGGVVTAVLVALAQDPALTGKVLTARHLRDLVVLVPLIAAAVTRSKVAPMVKLDGSGKA